MPENKEFLDRVKIYAHNNAIINHNGVGYNHNASYLSLVWVTKEQGPIVLKNMKRPHVQHALNWCIHQGKETSAKKDGIRYSDWIMYFTMRLFDPECE